MKKYVTGILILLVAGACISHKKVIAKSKKVVILDTVTVSAKNNEYRAAAPHVWDILHTRAALSFNWNDKTADGEAWIDLHPYFYTTDTLVLDAKGMKIDTLLVTKGRDQQKINYIYYSDRGQLFVFIGTTHADDTLQLYIKYTAMPYAGKTGGSNAIVDDRGLYFINADNKIPGKPMQIWTQGETESNSHWLPTIDKPNERFTTRIELTVPDTMQTLSNGYWAASTKEEHHLRRDIWIMDKPIQAYAIMFAIGRFDITKEEWKGREVSYYTEPAYTKYAKSIFRYTPEMIDHFSNITGVNYPWNKYSQIIVRDYVSGAMENTSATLCGEFMNETSREIADKDFEDVVSHELFHQWFGDLVTAESWSNITLNESFANYGEQLWRKHKYGEAYADRLAYEDLQRYMLYVAQAPDSPLVRYYYNDREDVFDPISYEKGGAILRYLNGLMGDTAFYRAMKIYLTKNALQSGQVSEWREAVEEATGQDWNWFFDEWYYRGDHPLLFISYKYDDSAQKLTVKITQKDSSGFVYRLPIRSLLIYGDEKLTESWDIRNKTTIFTYPYWDGVKPIVVPDEKRYMPGGYIDDKTPAAYLSQFIHSNSFASRRIALSKVQNKFSDSSSTEMVRLALQDTMPGIKEFCLELIRWVKDDKLVKKWQPQVILLALTDNKNAVRADAYDVLGSWEVQGTTQQIKDAVYDSSYSVAGAALNAMYETDSEMAYKIANELLSTHPKGRLESTIWNTFGKYASEEDISLFEKASVLAYGTNKFTIAYSLYTYMQRVNSDPAFEKGAGIIANMAMSDGIRGYRIGLGEYLFSLRDFYTVSKKHSKEYVAKAVKRKAILQHYIDKVVAAETDEGNLKRYKEMDASYSYLDR